MVKKGKDNQPINEMQWVERSKLKANDYNMKTNTVNLWQPPTQ